MSIKVSVFVAAAIGLATGRVFAQTQGDSTAGSTAAPVALDEIVVTAQKRAENLQTVPVAVSAVSAESLNDTGVHDVTDLKLSVPTLNVTNTNGRLTSSLRGVGAIAVGAGFENPVALYVDNVYYAATTASVLSLNNIAQVEVLKGPQGTLFGRNATAGLIQVTTRDPSHDPGAEINVGYANYQTSSVNAYLGGHVAPVLSGDVAVEYTHQNEGWGTNLYNGNDVYQLTHDLALRSKWILEPLQDTRITLIGDYSENASTANPLHTLPGTISGFAPQAGLAPDLGYDSNTDYNSFTRLRSMGGSLRLDQDFSAVSLASTTAYRKSKFFTGFDYDAITQNLGTIYFAQSDNQLSEELQLSSKAHEPFSWVVGAYYFHANSEYDPFNRTFTYLGTNTTLLNAQRTDSKAGYAQGTYAVVENTNLTLGVRYTSEERTAHGGVTNIVQLPSNKALPTTVAPDQDVTFDKLTFRMGLDHKFNDDLFGYASFNRGFKAGGFNAGAPGSAPFLPETLDAYELGLKMELLDHRVRINSAGFYYNYKNIQVQELVQGRLNILNGSEAHVYGFDLDVEAQLTRHLKLTGGVSWNNSTFESFPNCSISTPMGGVASVRGSCDGNQLPLATKASGNLALNYTTDLPVGMLTLTGNAYVNDGFYEEPDNEWRQPGYVQFGALGRWVAPGDHFSVALFGKNLSNVRVINYETTIPNGSHTGFYQAPRTYGITLGYKF